MTNINKIESLIKEFNVEFADLRFTDILGREQHISIPVSALDEDFFEEGKMFDGSSMVGWKAINNSDMVLFPILESAVLDPFFKVPTIAIRCNVNEPKTLQGYDRDPRSIALRSENYLKSTGLGDSVLVGSEPEFFLFDDVRFKSGQSGCSYEIDDIEAAWNTNKSYADGNKGHQVRAKGGYVPLPPVDSSQDLRSEMCLTMRDLGLVIEAHHHEVATAGQNEIATRFNSLTLKADETQIYKYVVRNCAHKANKTACFMPKPIFGDNGSGMHFHMSLSKAGHNIFAGDKYAGLSQEALYFIGGVIKHAKALNAFTNPSTNSYKRLVPGYEAPVLLAYSASNRSASIRIPTVSSVKARRIEVRFPDPLANPYLAFSAVLMAGLDGILNKTDPGDAMDKNLYDLPAEILKDIPTVALSLDDAIAALKNDCKFLTQGGVFSQDFIDAYCKVKEAEINKVRLMPHPIEFEMYY